MIRWPQVAVVDLIGVRRLPGVGRRLKRFANSQMTANPARASSAFKSALKPRAGQMLERADVYFPRKWLFLFADIFGQPVMCREYPCWPGWPRAHCGAVTSVSRAAESFGPTPTYQSFVICARAEATHHLVGHNATCRRLERTSSAVSGASLRRFEKWGPGR